MQLRMFLNFSSFYFSLESACQAYTTTHMVLEMEPRVPWVLSKHSTTELQVLPIRCCSDHVNNRHYWVCVYWALSAVSIAPLSAPIHDVFSADFDTNLDCFSPINFGIDYRAAKKKICEDNERRWYKWQRNVPRCQLLLLDISRLVTRIMQEKWREKSSMTLIKTAWIWACSLTEENHANMIIEWRIVLCILSHSCPFLLLTVAA